MRSPTLLACTTLLLLAGCNGTISTYAECEDVRCSVGSCEAPDGVPRCVCSAFEQAADARCDAPILMSDKSVDGEGNDSLATAKPLTPSALLESDLSIASDKDVFAVQLTEGHFYWLEAGLPFFSGFSQERVYFEMLDASGQPLWPGECLAPSNQNRLKPLKAPLTGSYFVRLSTTEGCRGNAFPQRYQLKLQALGPDDHPSEPGSATPIAFGQHEGVIELPGDVDAFAFDLQVGRVYRFACSAYLQDLCASLVLRDPSGAQLWRIDSRFQTPSYVIEPTVTGRHTVQLAAAAGAFGRYTYTLENLGTDDHGGTVETATVVTLVPDVPLRTQVTLLGASDRDVIAFDAQAGHTYVLSSDQPGPEGARVFDASGTTLGAVGTHAGRPFVLEAQREGRIFIEYYSGGSTSFVTYTVTLLDLGLDDYGNDAASATPITPGTTRGTLEARSDVDAFRLQAGAGHLYAVRCYACQVQFSGAQAAPLIAPGQGGGAATSYLVAAPGGADTWDLLVSGWAAATDYALFVEDLGAEDSGADPGTALPLQTGLERQGLLDSAQDVDTYWVDLAAGSDHLLVWYGPTVELVDPEGRSLGGPAPGAVGWNFRATSAGRYHLTIRSSAALPDASIYRFTLQ